MSKTQHDRRHNKGQNREEGHPHRPYWRGLHLHWYFWVGMLLMLVAIGNYVMTEDLAWVPRNQLQQPLSSADGK
ncbi:MAG: hypothetical protein ABI618_19740 [Nitrospirota bacterium]